MSAKKKSAFDYVTCRVDFTELGVKMSFKPEMGGNDDPATKSLTKAVYDKTVSLAKDLANPAGDGGEAIPSGQLLDHTRNVSKNRQTKFAFHLSGGTTWQFVNGGFAPRHPASKGLFSKPKVSRNGKLVEFVFTPGKKVKSYSYDLWLQAKVIENNVAPADRASVTVIIDPVIRSSTVP